MKKYISLTILAVSSSLALLLSGCGSGSNAASGPVSVGTAVVQRGQLDNSASVSGKIVAVEAADLMTKVPGQVAQVNVDVGSVVHKGEVLLTLDASIQNAAVNQAEAAVSAAQSAVRAAEAGQQAAQISFDTAQSNYERGQQLLASGAISQYVFDNQYKLPYDQAQVNLNQVIPAQIAQAEASVKTAQAGLQTAGANYRNTILTAPFSGVIVTRNVDPGDMTGTTPALVEVKLDQVYAQASVSEDQVNGLKEGQKASVQVTAASDQTFTGAIAHIASAQNPSSNNGYLVEVKLDNPGGILKPGMFCDVSFTEDTAGYLLVPNQAIVQEGSTSIVWVVKDEKAQKCQVQLGATDGINTIVDSGLNLGDTVIISGQQGLADGQKVTVKGD